MRSVVRGFLLGTVLAASVSTVQAQGVASNLRELQLLVRPGETVTVTDAQGREVKGRIETLSPSSLILSDRAGRHAWTETDIASIRQRRADSLWNGTLAGLAGGVAIGAVVGSAREDPDAIVDLATVYYPIIGAGIGAGVGLAIDAMSTKEYVVFQAAASPRPQVRVLPLLTPRRQGLLVSVAF